MIELDNIYCGDCEELLREIEDDSIDLIVTSPPYNDLRNYHNTLKNWNEDKFQRIANQLKRVLKDGGVIVWNVYDKTENGSKTGTSLRQCLYFQNIGMNINDYMIWEKTNPMPVVSQPRYNPCFEFMWVLSKGKPKTFNPIKVPCKCAGQKYDSTCKNIDGESGRKYKSFHINKEKVDNNIWKFAVAQNKTEHPAVFPEEIPYRHILSWTNEGDVVLDPFIGSGTTAVVAKRLNRHYIGIDSNKDYVDLSNNRINELK